MGCIQGHSERGGGGGNMLWAPQKHDKNDSE